MNNTINSVFYSIEHEIKDQLSRKKTVKSSYSYAKNKKIKSMTMLDSARITSNHLADSSSPNSLAIGDSAINVMRDMDVKNTFRKLFGKNNNLIEKIGCHPDFEYLKDSEDLVNGYAVTMFMDIVGSTKLGKLHPPETVFNIKNTIIKYAIEIIQAFDGHVHRIMGDAVMAFFRNSNKENTNKQNDSAIDALNCAIYVIEMMENVVTPILNDIGSEDPVGIRIGIDYGKHDDVIWGNYGAHNAFEVTATSYYVDIAAKLQQTARTNKIMIGNNLKKLIGFGNEYISTLKRTKKGDEVEIIYVQPNYKINKQPINYCQYELKNKDLFNFLPFGKWSDTKIKVKLTVSDKNGNLFDYKNCSSALDKNLDLLFEIEYPKTHLTKNLRLKSIKQNTGPESESKNDHHPEKKLHDMNYYNNSYHGKIEESTRYRGLHHMYIYICDEQYNEIDKTCFSLYIS